ncbi:MAG: galactokinase family protein [Gemmatimonadaceae bacterium]
MRIRRLNEVERDGDGRWFQPALDRIAAMRSDPDARARRFFDFDKALTVARAPGRLDVMGGIADYSGATVLQLPLDRSTSAIVQRNSDAHVEVATRRGNGWGFFSMPFDSLRTSDSLRTLGLRDPRALSAWFKARPHEHWAAYVVGVVQRVVDAAPMPHSDGGLRVVIDSTVPAGKGVSSSAALEVAVMSAVAAAYGVEIGAEQSATACQWVENHIVGAPCGIMDQMTSACGVADRLLRLKCQPDRIEGNLEIPSGFQFFGIDSGVRHAVTGADYGTVRTAAFMGYRIIADAAGLTATENGGRIQVEDPNWNGYLANLSPGEFDATYRSLLPETLRGSEFLARYGGTTDTVTHVLADREYPVRNATAHPIYEQDRVIRFTGLLAELSDRRAAASELGALMYESHASYSACGLGSDGTDRLVEMIAAEGARRGLFGAKITGGGSGGTVAVLADASALPVVAGISNRYSKETGRDSEVFAASGPGADQTGVLILE